MIPSTPPEVFIEDYEICPSCERRPCILAVRDTRSGVVIRLLPYAVLVEARLIPSGRWVCAKSLMLYHVGLVGWLAAHKMFWLVPRRWRERTRRIEVVVWLTPEAEERRVPQGRYDEIRSRHVCCICYREATGHDWQPPKPAPPAIPRSIDEAFEV